MTVTVQQAEKEATIYTALRIGLRIEHKGYTFCADVDGNLCVLAWNQDGEERLIRTFEDTGVTIRAIAKGISDFAYTAMMANIALNKMHQVE